MTPLETTDAARQLAEEILSHAQQLVCAPLADSAREHLLQIRQAGNGLLAILGTTEAALEPDSVVVAEPSAPGKPTEHQILLVEDNPFTQKLMMRLLTQQGYQVMVAHHGQEALELLNQKPLDLVLMDLRMPVMDGFQATQEIRERELHSGARRVPIIAVTALAADEEQKRALDVGMDGYHIKPVRAAILFAEMERLLHAHPVSAATVVDEGVEEKLIVDLDRLLKTVDGDLELLREVTELYFSDAPRQMARIERAIAAGDGNEVREAAHSLKGATGAFGRVQVYDLALALEQAGHRNELHGAAELWQQLKSALQIMQETIQKEIAMLSGGAS
ncbi:MAG: response regulator [Magnetococcales bacterium]|nr:response regulator [Magnetococcales bacterium]NGZ06243.1 response regulator [Magnetococcales bacterium]